MCTYNFKSLTPAYDSSESDDDFDKAFQPLIILLIVICSWVTLGEPTESEKQVMQAKSYISDHLITHMNLKIMVKNT